MKRTQIVAIVASNLLALSAFAGGPADKVTGDFVRLADTSSQEWTCEFTAHEAIGNRGKKGSLYCAKSNASDWWEVDLASESACVHVYSDGKARLGGMAVRGYPTSRIGAFYGMEVEDNGEPGAYTDTLDIKTFTATTFASFCASGLGSGGISPYTIIEGNLQVHNFSTDGD